MNLFKIASISLGVLISILFSLYTDPTMANGAGKEIFREINKPFELIVRAQPEIPTVGTVHFTFEPLIADTNLPLYHGSIKVLARDESGLDRYEVKAVNTPQDRSYYDANITFEEPGQWSLMVHIESREFDPVTFEIPVLIQSQALPPRTLAGTIIWLLVACILAGGSTVVWYRARQLTRENKSSKLGNDAPNQETQHPTD